MNRSNISLLAAGLAFCLAAGNASAQSSGYGGYSNDGYSQPSTSNVYGQGNGAGYYDYARVVRVSPVIGNGTNYPASSSPRCYTRQDSYAGNDGYYGNNTYGSYGGNNGYYGNQPYGNDGYYGNQNNGSTAGRTMATVIGGVLGAAIGSQVGGGSARYATSAIGSMVGGMAGRQVYESTRRTPTPSGTVTVCDPVPVNSGTYGANTYNAGGVNAYDVTYEYGGRQYTTRTNYNPGNQIRVRVDVRPE